MTPNLNKTWHWLPNIAGVFSFLLVAFVGMVVYDTLTDTLTDNIEMDTHYTIRGWMEGTTFVLVYERGFTVHRDRVGVVYRTVICPPDEASYLLDAAPVRRMYEAKYYQPVKRPLSFYLDKPLPIGTKCALRVEGEWKGGTFAISSKRQLLDQLEFVVGEKP